MGSPIKMHQTPYILRLNLVLLQAKVEKINSGADSSYMAWLVSSAKLDNMA